MAEKWEGASGIGGGEGAAGDQSGTRNPQEELTYGGRGKGKLISTEGPLTAGCLRLFSRMAYRSFDFLVKTIYCDKVNNGTEEYFRGAVFAVPVY